LGTLTPVKFCPGLSKITPALTIILIHVYITLMQRTPKKTHCRKILSTDL
jgi:hypothetical protein